MLSLFQRIKIKKKVKKPPKRFYSLLEYLDGKKKKMKRIKDTKQIQSKKIIVLQNLPKLRQNGQLKELTEFLEVFYKAMKAHNISLQRYLNLLFLYLDTIDN
jgi:hypothetical protein